MPANVRTSKHLQPELIRQSNSCVGWCVHAKKKPYHNVARLWFFRSFFIKSRAGELRPSLRQPQQKSEACPTMPCISLVYLFIYWTYMFKAKLGKQTRSWHRGVGHENGETGDLSRWLRTSDAFWIFLRCPRQKLPEASKVCRTPCCWIAKKPEVVCLKRRTVTHLCPPQLQKNALVQGSKVLVRKPPTHSSTTSANAFAFLAQNIVTVTNLQITGQFP